jgi:hypothetical protein
MKDNEDEPFQFNSKCVKTIIAAQEAFQEINAGLKDYDPARGFWCYMHQSNVQTIFNPKSKWGKRDYIPITADTERIINQQNKVLADWKYKVESKFKNRMASSFQKQTNSLEVTKSESVVDSESEEEEKEDLKKVEKKNAVDDQAKILANRIILAEQDLRGKHQKPDLILFLKTRLNL